MNTKLNSENDIEQLNALLRGELSAVETYRQCLDRITDTVVRLQLEPLHASHRDRADKLAQRILNLGGKPSETSGPWGTFAKLVEGSAQLFGERPALAALEEGEDHGCDQYSRDLDTLTEESRRFVEIVLAPEQQRTHDVMSAISAAR